MLFKNKSSDKKPEKFAIHLLSDANPQNANNLQNWLRQSLPLLLNFYAEQTQFELNEFELNFGQFSCHSIDKLFGYLQHKKEVIDSLIICNQAVDFIYICFNAFPFENRFEICVDYAYKDALLNMMLNLPLELWQYGYGMNLSAQQNLNGSSVKRGFFSTQDIPSAEENIWMEWRQNTPALLAKGYLKKIYPVNILNAQQAANIELESMIQQKIGVVNCQHEKLIWQLSAAERQQAIARLKYNTFLLSNQ